MIELRYVVARAVRAAIPGRNDLILENLLLRQQLQVALRPKRRLPLTARVLTVSVCTTKRSAAKMPLSSFARKVRQLGLGGRFGRGRR